MEEKPAVATTSPVAAPNIQSKPLASPGKAINPETGEEYTPVDYSKDQLQEPPVAGAEEANPAVDVNAPLQEPPVAGAEKANPGADPATPAVTANPAVAPAKTAYKGSAGAQEIQKLNPAIKDVNKIQPGQTLKMPDGSTYTVKPGDTLDRIAKGTKPAPDKFDKAPAAAPAQPAPAQPAPAQPAPGAPFKKELPPELSRIKQLSGTKPVIPGGIADIANQVAGAKPAPLTAKESMERLLAITRLQ
jgi:LysM repeat protein